MFHFAVKKSTPPPQSDQDLPAPPPPPPPPPVAPTTEATSLTNLTCLTSASPSPKQSKCGKQKAFPESAKSNSNSNCSSSAENLSAKERLTAGLNTSAVDDENNWEDDESGSGCGAARNRQGSRLLDNRQG